MSQNPLTSPSPNMDQDHRNGLRPARMEQLSTWVLLVIGLLLLLMGLMSQLWGAVDMGVLAVIMAVSIFVLSHSRLSR